MEQFEQLLTCAICLDRYRNPKLLPCQHSFCMEPCMDGLVDYVRRQVKCPECRAEHRIPYQGVQAFPTNVTLQRFLELHIEITGELPDPTSGQVMERCNVCSEKSYCSLCIHCEKKCCADCKSAHMDILRREIFRINNQIRRGVNRLQDSLASIEKNMLNLQTNCTAVGEEVDEINRRLAKALKDRTEHLRTEIDKYLTSELKNLLLLKDNLELEISNIQSNCDLADKYINEEVAWEDAELMDTKDLFLKTVEFIRNFEYETSDYTRRVRFVMSHDPNQLVLHMATYGDLNIHQGYATSLAQSLSSSNLASQAGSGAGNNLQIPSSSSGSSVGGGLMRSKSDHRLVYKQQMDDRNPYESADSEITGLGRKFGERSDHDSESSRPVRSRYRSRLSRYQENDSDTELASNKSVRFNETQSKEPTRKRAFDTEDIARGPLSGIFRLFDSPRVMQKIHENDNKARKKEQAVTIAAAAVLSKRPSLKSNGDETESVQRKPQRTSITETDSKPKLDRISALKYNVSTEESDDSRHSSPSRRTLTPKQSAEVSSEVDSDESVQDLQKKSKAGNSKGQATASSSSLSSSSATPSGRRTSTLLSQSTSDNTSKNKSIRSISSDSSTSDTSSSSTAGSVRNTGAAYSAEELKKKFLSKTTPTNGTANATVPTAAASTTNVAVTSAADDKKVFQSRFLNRNRQLDSETGNGSSNGSSNSARKTPRQLVSDSSSEEETDDSDENESEDENAKTNADKKTSEMANTDIGPLLARSAQARDSRDNSRKNSGDSSVTAKTSTSAASGGEDTSTTGRYVPYKSRQATATLARSKSSHVFADDGDDHETNESGNLSAISSSPNAYLASRGYPTSTSSSTPSASTSSNDISRSRSTHTLKSRESSPDRTADKDASSLSSWARYLKSKYGNRNSTPSSSSSGLLKDKDSSSASLPTSSSSSSTPASRRFSSTHYDDDQKNIQGSLTSAAAAAAAAAVVSAVVVPAAGVAAVADSTADTTTTTTTVLVDSCRKNFYLNKKLAEFRIGSRGSENGMFTWPRGIAVGPDNTIVVADSSNHRVQVFNACGTFLKEFGQYGNNESEFDCLADVVINRIGQFIVSDRYNHRIQVFDPSGRFLRSFGSQGTTDGRFNYPWGIATDSLGFIYVCDKENHRIQVFQSDGTFVGKFGTFGNKLGQMDHPHYVSVSNTNRVIISDTNNHRIQIFDVNGRVLKSFGSEGTEKGQFKFPRGVTVDDQGFIFVADSGNNRIQIFTPDMQFLHSFGTWGSENGEFKGLEGIAVTSNGKILVCDRENHRIQAF